MNHIRNSSWISSLAVVALLSTIGLSRAQEPSPNRLRAAATSLAAAESLSDAFQAAANAIVPSVVKIRTITSGRNRVVIRGFSPMEAPDQEGLGSGVIVDSEGIVMTNNHVVKDADEVIVVLQDGTELYATEYTTDPLTDLAIVRVNSKVKLPAARLGDSDALHVGDWVLAVGHPLELETSVSAGIISAKGRSLSKVPRAQFLQTDAAINPGNSGGPLVNLRGEVIGINTAIASQTGGYQGIGFAVPTNLARDVVQQLRDQGTVARGYLGVTIQRLTRDLAEQLMARSELSGVVVNQVKDGTPAARAGVRPGDVITHFASYPVDSPSSLQRAVERVPIGSNQRLNFIRFGKPMAATVGTLRFDQDQFGEEFQSVTKRLSAPVRDHSSLGFEVADLSEVASGWGLQTDQQAVVITRVARDSLAAEEGLMPGMLVKQVSDNEVSTVSEFRAALRRASLSEGILLLVKDTSRNGSGLERFLVLRSRQ